MGPQEYQQQQQQPFTPNSASAIYASPASENGRLPPPLSQPQNGASHLSMAPAAAAAVVPKAEPSPSSSVTPGHQFNGFKRGESIDGNSASPDAAHPDQPSRKKQRRNKPTLSCAECVERKTKVHRWSLGWRVDAAPKCWRRDLDGKVHRRVAANC
ncbi:Zn(II)2Cys6 transcription factor [Colletotrichum tofieldiae]|nr:Zn(II)2Cys6 transcription factor [Colletotrichum tofieldiae]